MLTDWERNQLAEIERGLAADFTPRRRLRRRLHSIGPFGATAAVLALGCLVALSIIGAWWSVFGVTAALGVFEVGRKTRRRRRSRYRRRRSVA